MGIPNYPEFKELNLEDKEEFEKYYFSREINISDHTFANYFIWRNLDRTKLTMIEGFLCPLVIGPDKNKYFMMPLGSFEGQNINNILKICLDEAKAIIRVDEYFLSNLPTNRGFEIVEDRDQFDYIYLADDLANLKGRKYDSKRNHINYFLKNYDFRYERMNSTHIKECIELNELWCKSKENEKHPVIECEYYAVNEALKNIDFLGLIGGIIVANGKIVAFSLGEKLTDDTAVIHIEKSDPALRGAAQLINREFVRNEWQHFKYINREQDMGHSGLRKAKMSYYPVELRRKWNIRMKYDG